MSSPQNTINIIQNITHPFHTKCNIKKTIHKICSIKGISKASFEINLLTNPEIKQINTDFLSHNYETDIITFNLSENGELIGDIYISTEEASHNAKKYNKSIDEEITLLLIHGILHLLHYNDDTEKNKKIMRNEENRLLKLIHD